MIKLDKLKEAHSIVPSSYDPSFNKPSLPTYYVDSEILEKSYNIFKYVFGSNILYPYKVNNNPIVVGELLRLGVNKLDIASIAEIEHFQQNHGNSAKFFYSNPNRCKEETYQAIVLGVTDFTVDSLGAYFNLLEVLELVKKNEECKIEEITIHLRVKIEGCTSEVNLNDRFGASVDTALFILSDPKLENNSYYNTEIKYGLSFHVGSSTKTVDNYIKALDVCLNIANKHEDIISSINIGGGFPIVDGEDNIKNNKEWLKLISYKLKTISMVIPGLTFYAEPGRSLVAEAISFIVQVVSVNQGNISLNAGVYGGLLDVSMMSKRVILEQLHIAHPIAINKDFTLYGPTCDSMDKLGVYSLPITIEEGDLLAIQNAGAYTTVMNTFFNGYGKEKFIVI